MNQIADTSSLGALLAWYREMGVDCAVGDEAENWLARPDRAPGHGFSLPGEAVGAARIESAPAGRPAAAPMPSHHPASPAAPAAGFAPIRPAAQPMAPPVRAPAVAPPGEAETAARSAARGAATLDALGEALGGFNGCALKATAKTLCFYRGAPKARLMIVGEAPGREEDLAGKPFVGPAGQLLDKMLAAIGLDEASVHITNVVYWRPPGNRTPAPQETQACKPFLERQAELVEPDIVMALGGAATKHLVDVNEGIMRIRGKWYDTNLGRRRVRVLAALHPAYLLRTPAAKRLAWRDLLALKAALAGESPER